ncbi:MAG TPA: cache domain-containing protein, partial [Candidatus Omnitrophota bacterium]|nr:cache domain-containing protein [Candidatus Omnitrophota bacterium]
MDRDKFFGLRLKMITLFGLLFLAGSMSLEWARLYGIPFVGFEGVQYVLKKNTLDNFSVIADLQKDNITAWLLERKYDVKAIAANQLLRENLQELSRLRKEYRKQGKSGEELWQALSQEPSYKESRNFLHQAQQVYGNVFHRFTVVDNSTGFAVVPPHDEDYGKKILDARLNSIDLTEGGVFVTIRQCDLIGGAGDFLLAAPVTGEGARGDEPAKEDELLLVTYVNLGSFLSPMLNAAKGLGRSGEVVLVNQDQRILTPLKFPLKDGTKPVPLGYTINAEPARRAASGEEGVLEGRDYRGVKVLAAYRNIPISYKESIGMVVKENFDDVFWPVRENLFYSLGVTFLGMLLGMIAIYLLSSSLVRPIKRMAEVARRAQAG